MRSRSRWPLENEQLYIYIYIQCIVYKHNTTVNSEIDTPIYYFKTHDQHDHFSNLIKISHLFADLTYLI